MISKKAWNFSGPFAFQSLAIVLLVFRAAAVNEFLRRFSGEAQLIKNYSNRVSSVFHGKYYPADNADFRRTKS